MYDEHIIIGRILITYKYDIKLQKIYLFGFKMLKRKHFEVLNPS